MKNIFKFGKFKKIKITKIYVSFKPTKKNDLNNAQAMFSDVIGCSIGIYDFTLLNSSIKR